SSYILKGGAEHDTRVIAFLKRHYLRMLKVAMANSRKTVVAAVVAFLGTLAIVPLLGSSFMPEMKEGSIVPAIDRVPNISLEESIKL
ncbi:efflux RND transporter permease subunit, partial [Salmonella enterica subsp. enterica]